MRVNICMIAYTKFSSEPRVIREAETLASVDAYQVSIFVPRAGDKARHYVTNKVSVKELDVGTYQGRSQQKYLLSYFNVFLKAFFASTMLFFWVWSYVFHVHNMPDFLVFVALIPRLFGKKIILDLHN